MDLGECPKCAKKWVPGYERCPLCGFVPIGAGLRNLPKKIKKKFKYREPGSSTGFLLVCFALTFGLIALEQKPWRNNFEPIRVVFGAEPTKSLAGDWQVTKIIYLDPKTHVQIAPASMNAGSFQFQSDGKVTFAIGQTGNDPTQAAAKYTQEGQKLVISDFTDASGAKLPSDIKTTISWQGDDTVEMITDFSVLSLAKVKPGDDAAQVARFTYKNGGLQSG